ncbi:hypothetical protein SAMN05446935_3925 [Burkholderia sp. YR290]|nr:hypothetical protein SAMN05446935_3925 [Burkholderia sp. YR290]
MAVVTGYAEVISPYVTAPGALWDGAFRGFCEAREMATEGEKLQRPQCCERSCYSKANRCNHNDSPKPQPAIVARTVYSPSGTATASRSSDV